MAATVHEQIESLPHSLNPGETDANSFETDGTHDATIDKAKPEPLKQFYGPLSGSKTSSSLAAGSKNEATKERSNQISKKLVHLGFGFPMSKVYLEYWGGSIDISTMQGYGTDVYVKVGKRGVMMEHVEDS